MRWHRERSRKSGRDVLEGVHRYSGLKDTILGSDLSSRMYEKSCVPNFMKYIDDKIVDKIICLYLKIYIRICNVHQWWFPIVIKNISARRNKIYLTWEYVFDVTFGILHVLSFIFSLLNHIFSVFSSLTQISL